MYLWNGSPSDEYPLPIEISPHQQWHASLPDTHSFVSILFLQAHFQRTAQHPTEK